MTDTAFSARARSNVAGILSRFIERTNNWSISRKLLTIFGGFAAAFFLSALIIGGGLLGTSGAVQDMTRLSAVQASIGDASSAMKSAQGRVKDYVITPSPELAARVSDEFTAANEALMTVETQADALNLGEQLAELKTVLTSENTAFEEIREAQEYISSDIDPVLDTTGPDIGAKLGSIVSETFTRRNYTASNRAAEALNHYSEARINVNRFRSSGDEAAIERARANLLDLEDSLNGVFDVVDDSGLVAEADAVIEEVVEYEKAFTELVASTRQRDAGVERLITVTGPRFDADLGALETDVRNQVLEATGTASASMNVTLGAMVFAALATLIVCFLGFTGARRLVERPISDLTVTMLRLANGEDIDLEQTDRRDEIGKMTRAVTVFAENAREVERQRKAAAEAERRELEQERERDAERRAERERAEADKKAALEELAKAFEDSVHSVAAAIGSAASQIEDGAKQVSHAANENATVTANVAATAEQSSQNALAVANASEEMARSIAEVSAQVIESSAKSQDAADRARKTDGIVAGLADDANKIGEVVELINSIAEQTNLLALNATIEAARAGDAGRGFAVVAGEIKALASQTSKATTQIAERVSGIQSVTGDAVRAIEEIGNAITDIDNIAATVASAVEQQSATTSEIASNTQQAAGGSEQVAQNIEAVRSGIEETGVAAEQSLAAAAELSKQASTLQREVDAFLARVRAA